MLYRRLARHKSHIPYCPRVTLILTMTTNLGKRRRPASTFLGISPRFPAARPLLFCLPEDTCPAWRRGPGQRLRGGPPHRPNSFWHERLGTSTQLAVSSRSTLSPPVDPARTRPGDRPAAGHHLVVLRNRYRIGGAHGSAVPMPSGRAKPTPSSRSELSPGLSIWQINAPFPAFP